MKKVAFITFLAVLSLTGCDRKEVRLNLSDAPEKSDAEESRLPEELESLSPEDGFLLVEQAVDSWMYFHLLDYSSYTPLIRSTDYDPLNDSYIHHVRYRGANVMGGLETHEKTFEVSLHLTSGRLDDFDVNDITGSHNPTETPR